MSESDNIIVDTTAKILGDLCDPQTINKAKDDNWKRPLWQALEENGLTRTWVPEAFNGVGAEFTDGFEVLRVAQLQFRHWRNAIGGLATLGRASAPDGMLSVAPVNNDDKITLEDDGTLTGKAHVPYGREVAQIAVLAEKVKAGR